MRVRVCASLVVKIHYAFQSVEILYIFFDIAHQLVCSVSCLLHPRLYFTYLPLHPELSLIHLHVPFLECTLNSSCWWNVNDCQSYVNWNAVPDYSQIHSDQNPEWPKPYWKYVQKEIFLILFRILLKNLSVFQWSIAIKNTAHLFSKIPLLSNINS